MILALDIGDKRVGTALSDEHEKFAYPHQTFNRAKGQAEEQILALLKEKNIGTLVVGIPLGEHSEKNEQCLKVESFSRRIIRRYPVTLEFVDEYGSSLEAAERLGYSGRKQRATRQKGIIDSVSASIILQSFLDKKGK